MLLFGKKITTSLSKSIIKRIIQFWFRRYRYFFVLFFLGTVFSGGYFWQNSVQSYSWTEDRKGEYLRTHAREIEFQERSFLRVLERLEERERIHNEIPEFKDYFHADGK